MVPAPLPASALIRYSNHRLRNRASEDAHAFLRAGDPKAFGIANFSLSSRSTRRREVRFGGMPKARAGLAAQNACASQKILDPKTFGLPLQRRY